jgi:iron complex outermembrane receptor protein
MKRVLFSSAAVLALSMSSVAMAQTAAGPSDAPPTGDAPAAQIDDAAPAQVADIVVTAEKRSTSLQRVAAAITAQTGETLAQVGVVDQSQLSKLVPGLAIAAQGGNGVAFLRGVGQTQGSPNAQPGVAINTNGVYLPRESGTTALYDVERVEVLPGPQGTLWGRNAAGGAVNFITKRPTFETEVSGSVEVGNYEYVRPIVAVNVPLGETFAVRAAGEYNKRDGFLSNGANDRDAYSGRVSALFEPTDRLSAFVMGSFTHEGGIGSQSVLYSERGVRGQFNPTGDLYNQTFPTTLLKTSRDFLLVQGEFTYDLTDGVNVTYIPAYVEIDADEVIQFQGVRPARLVRAVEQWSHEVRLASTGSGPFQWVLGGYLYSATHDFVNTVGVELPTPVGTVRFFNDLDSKAVFGQATYSLSDSLRLTAGGRYSRDRFDGFARTATPPRSEAAPLIGANRNTDSRVDWKVGFEADVGARSMLYGTVQTGYLMGGFTQDGRLFKPATLTAYTVGTKNRFLNNALTANLEFFYYDYKDYQLQYVQGTSFLTANSPARIYGLQLDLVAQPGPNDTFNINASAQNATIRDKTNLYLRDGVATSISGFRLPNAPDYTITAGWNHKFRLGGGAVLESFVQTYFNAGYYTVFTQDLNTRQRAYTNTDMTLTYRPASRSWSLGAFVRNLEDEAVVVGATYGVRAEFSF